MKLLILASLVAAAVCAPQGYNQGPVPTPAFNTGGSGSVFVGGGGASLGTGGGIGLGFSSETRSDSYEAGSRGASGFTGGSLGGGGGGGGGFSSGGFASGGGSFGSSGGQGGGGGGYNGGGGGGGGGFRQSCADDEVLHVDGTCVRPIIDRQIFVYKAPDVQVRSGPPPILPKPRVNYNIVFVRSPQQIGGVKPIVVPPPQQKTLVYVLNQRTDGIQQEVIEVPSTPTQPEVYFVNYGQGENPQLPGGIDLQQALSQSVQQGQVIDGGAGTGFRGDGSVEFDDGSSGGHGGGFGGVGGGVGGGIGGGIDGGIGGGIGGGFGGGGIGGGIGGGVGGGFGGGVREDYSAPVAPQPQPPSGVYSSP